MAENLQIINQVFTLIQLNKGYLRIKVSPNAPRTIFKDILADNHNTVKTAVHASPEKGKANEELLAYLQKTFPDYQPQIISGHTSALKLIRFNNYHE